MKGFRFRPLLRLLAAGLLGLSLVLPAAAEVVTLDRDIMTYGFPSRKEGWSKNKDEYQDESIHIKVYHKSRKPKSSHVKVTCRWVTISVASPSQLRTALSNDSYDDPGEIGAPTLARHVNAIVAMNGDYFKYNYGKGYVLRQGVFYRDALDGTWDSLIIDDRGDFHGVREATSESMAAALSDLRAQGREPVNVFTFGPILVENGQIVREEYTSEMHYSGLSTQRIALLQLGELEYAIVEIDSPEGNGSGMNLHELARFILEIFPDCKMAYNFDGGGSTHLVVNGKQIHETKAGRAVGDIVYFASAQKPEE